MAKYATFLHDHKFKLLISLDGDKPHDAYRKTFDKQESFEMVMANLQEVKENYPDWFSTFRYNAVYTNISDIEDIVKWFRKTFNKVPNFSPLHTPTEGAKEYVKIKSMTAKYEIPEDIRFSDDLIAQSPINKRVMEFCNSLFQNTIYKETNMFEERRNRYTRNHFVRSSGQKNDNESQKTRLSNNNVLHRFEYEIRKYLPHC